MENLKRWINISLVLLLIIVLAFYMIKRFGVQIELPEINKEYCGDNVCQTQENEANCCKDCGCPNNQFCVENKCQISTSIQTSTSITSNLPQTTINGTSSAGGAASSQTEGGGATSETTTQTTVYIGCSINNCEACENSTACYNVGCIWCKVSERCLIICKG